MLHEISLGGVLLPPLVPLIVISLLLFLPLHRAISRVDGYRFFWHPALAGLCLFLILLALVLWVGLTWSAHG